MATGDQSDFADRLRAVLPASWFPSAAALAFVPAGDGVGETFAIGVSGIGLYTTAQAEVSATPVLDGVLAGFGACFAWLYSLIGYVNLNGRLATATGAALDLIGLDFLGTALLRKSGQTDESWRSRIQTEILAPKATRPAMSQRLLDLTGRAPVIFEPMNPHDTGGYSVGGVGYGVAGGYGDMLLPFQCFVTAYRPNGGGLANIAGYGNRTTFLHGAGGYGVGAIEYASLSMLHGEVTDDDINSAIVSCASAATIPWTRISN